MTTTHLILLQLVVPVLLLLWHGFRREKTMLLWLVKSALIVAYLALILVAGIWMVIPRWSGFLLLGLWVGLTALSPPRRRPPGGPGFTGWRWLRGALLVSFTLALLALTTYAVAAHRPPKIRPYSVLFPLRNGTYYVASGGSKQLLNAHLKTLGPGHASYRGQSYGVDIVKLNGLGVRSAGLRPHRLRQYESFGDPVCAPCAGTVKSSEGTRLDAVPPARDRVHMEGNYVLLACDGADLFIGHLARGTVVVHPGQRISPGQLLGKVGNSGNSDEPHLHIHAQRPVVGTGPRLHADPLPIAFEGVYPARNDQVTVAGGCR